MDGFDLQILSNAQRSTLDSFVRYLIDHALDDEESTKLYRRIDSALEQVYTEPPVNPSGDPNIDQSDINVENDGVEEMFTPLIYKTQKGWVTHLKHACMPGPSDWYSIDKTYSPLFYKLGIQDFLPEMNNAWIKNIEIENSTFKRGKKIKTGLTQFATYGFSPGVVYYDTQDDFVDLSVPHCRDYGIFPVSDDWRKSNNIIRYPVNYVDLLKREDLDQEVLAAVQPDTSWNVEDTNKYTTATEKSSYYEEKKSPFGKLMLHDIWMPSLYIQEDEGAQVPEVAEHGVYLTVLINPQIKSTYRERLPAHKVSNGIYILKSSTNVNPEVLEILFAAFDETLPGQQHGRGPLAPFLIYQEVQNALIKGMTREMVRETDPPLEITSEEQDASEADIPPFESGALYRGVNVRAINVEGHDKRMQAGLNWDRYTTDKVEEGSGMNRMKLGAQEPTKRTKYELESRQDNGNLRINDAADLFDEHYLQPLMRSILKQTQYQLQKQVEQGVAYIRQIDRSLDYESALEITLEANKLYKRLFGNLEIEKRYTEFYKEYRRKQVKNDEYIEEFQNITQRLAKAQEELAVPVPQFEPPPLGDYNEAEIKKLEDEYYQVKREEKQILEQTVTNLTLESKTVKEQIEDLPDIPQPSHRLYFLIMSDPIEETNIMVHGSKTSMNKSQMRNAIIDIMMMLENVDPEVIRELDFKCLLKKYFNSVGLNFEDMRKSQVEINRLESLIERQQAQAQQLANAGQAQGQ